MSLIKIIFCYENTVCYKIVLEKKATNISEYVLK